MTCLLTWGAVVLLFPVIFLLWLTESKQQRAKRMRKAGHTYKTIASRLSIEFHYRPSLRPRLEGFLHSFAAFRSSLRCSARLIASSLPGGSSSG